MKQLIYFFSLLVLTFSIRTDQPFENYHQSIPGTDMQVEMIAIPGGSFTMGSTNKPDEQPVHQVEVSPFWMAKYETTWNLYRLYRERNLDTEQPQQLEGTEVKIKVDAVARATTPYVDMSFGMGTDGYPAIGMTQLAAAKFCEWLSAMTGNFYRLPTEAEWEYAARAETTTDYSFGNDTGQLSEYAWFKDNSEEAYHPTGEKKPNPWGLYDMHGNVAEWTLDAYQSTYQTSERQNPWVVPVKTYPRVVRGGSWVDEADALRSAARKASDKSWKKRDPQIPKSLWWHTDAPFVGFRIVRPLYTPSEEEQRQYWGYQ
ncbi:formylglycine-generating enzyme family protein [Roseivirga sp.]|uniref:formylglycine-generating enzyme family protein n=1 Tax=Roseivirga sp. TaxID=1964215 RepID=UPI003B51CDE7